MSLLKQISDEYKGIFALMMSFIFGGLSFALVGDLRGLDDRVKSLEERQVILTEAVIQMQCDRRIADGLYVSYSECWEDLTGQRPGASNR